jgi:hypothetical protein
MVKTVEGISLHEHRGDFCGLKLCSNNSVLMAALELELLIDFELTEAQNGRLDSVKGAQNDIHRFQ